MIEHCFFRTSVLTRLRQGLLVKRAAPDPVIAGQLLTYTFEVTNAGPNSAVDVVLRDATPPNTTFVSATAPDGWTIIPPVGSTGDITFTNPGVPPDIEDFLSVLRNLSTLRDMLAAPPMFTIVVRVDPSRGTHQRRQWPGRLAHHRLRMASRGVR